MKLFLTVACLHICTSLVIGQRPFSGYLKCKRDTNLSDGDASGIQRGLLPKTRNGRCFVACLLKSAGLVNTNGKISTQAVMDHVKKFTSNSTIIKNSEKVALQCSQEANVENDSCDSAYSFHKCIAQQLDQRRRQSRSGRLSKTIAIPDFPALPVLPALPELPALPALPALPLPALPAINLPPVTIVLALLNLGLG